MWDFVRERNTTRDIALVNLHKLTRLTIHLTSRWQLDMAHQTLQPETPHQGKIWLILYKPSDNQGNFYLHIPIYIIEPLCLRPRKYLRYLGWCVLGINGRVTLGTQDIGDEGELVDQGVYHYVVDATGFSRFPSVDTRADYRPYSCRSAGTRNRPRSHQTAKHGLILGISTFWIYLDPKQLPRKPYGA